MGPLSASGVSYGEGRRASVAFVAAANRGWTERTVTSGGGYQRRRWASQAQAVRAWPAWNERRVGRPGGGGCSDW
jgi:hypothetical protein